jgi:hypothetical protein
VKGGDEDDEEGGGDKDDEDDEDDEEGGGDEDDKDEEEGGGDEDDEGKKRLLGVRGKERPRVVCSIRDACACTTGSVMGKADRGIDSMGGASPTKIATAFET